MSSLQMATKRALTTLVVRHKHSASSSATSVTVDVGGGAQMTLETGRLARIADGCAVARIGDTSVMVTAVSRKKPPPSPSFLPLVVDYRHKAAASGKIPVNFFRRELGPSDQEILTSRLIDRSIRPLFSQGYYCDTQLMCNLLAVDGSNDPDVVALNAASAALSLSDIPWNGPVGAVRLGLVGDKVIINPNRKAKRESRLNAILSGCLDNQVVMVEMDGRQVPIDALEEAIKQGLTATNTICEQIQDLRRKVGKVKREVEMIFPSAEVMSQTKNLAGERLRAIYLKGSYDKLSRDDAIFTLRDAVISKVCEDPTILRGIAEKAFVGVQRDVYREVVLSQSVRCDGRDTETSRPVSCEIDLYAPLHGSSLFQRGQTQVLTTVSLDNRQAAFQGDPSSILTGAASEKRFMLHYDFPPYATNEVGMGRMYGRRELGHGALAEKSVAAVTSIGASFPFTVRLMCECLESNGSSSMASVCAASLALMDAGVPLETPVAGVAMGLLAEMDTSSSTTRIKDYRVLTDISGIEDFLGEMDLKIAGTKLGFTGMQLDLKMPGLPVDILIESMRKASVAHGKLLEIMNSVIAESRSSLKENGPVSQTITVPLNKRAQLFGAGGYNVKKLQSDTGVRLTQLDETTFELFASDADAMTDAKAALDALMADVREPQLDFGAIYRATITEMRENGVMVKLDPNMTPALIPNSQLDARRIHHPSALNLKVGDVLTVKYMGRDPQTGSHRISRKMLQVTDVASRLRRKVSVAPSTEESETDAKADVTRTVANPWS